MQTRQGFTLAEVLVTLAIIGVVASLTIPSLVNTVNKQQYVTGLLTAYSTLAQATSQLINDNNGTMVNLVNNGGNWQVQTDFINKYCTILNCVKLCLPGETSPGGNCFSTSSNMKMIDGGDSFIEPNDTQGFVLADGMLVIGNLDSIDCTANCGGDCSPHCGFFIVDVNGFKGPNIIGRDIFGFNITQNGLVPFGGLPVDYLTDYSVFCAPTTHASAQNGMGCAVRILRDGNQMNY